MLPLQHTVQLRFEIYCTRKRCTLLKSDKSALFCIKKKLYRFKSATSYNLLFRYITRNINEGTLRTSGGQIIAYVDDIADIN